MSSVAGRRERTPLRSRFSAANRVYSDIPMSPETPETPRTSASTGASSPFMDAVRNVKERGERDWKRLFNKFQEQDSEARHPLDITRSPGRLNSRELTDSYYSGRLQDFLDYEDQYDALTPPLDAPSPATSSSSRSQRSYELSPYQQRHSGLYRSPYRSPMRSTYAKVSLQNDDIDIVEVLESENVRLDNLQQKLDTIRQQAAELARPYARKTLSTPIRNYQDRKRNPNWDKSSRKSSVSSIHPLPRSAPQQADSPYNHADFTMTPASGYTSPRSRYTEMKHDDDSHSLCHSTASDVKNSPKPLLSPSTDTKQVATSASSLAAPPPPPPPPPPPLPSTNYSVPRKTAPIRGTPVKPQTSSAENEATPMRNMRRVLTELPKTTLRRTDVIQTPRGSRVRNKIWDEIHGAECEPSPVKESQSTPIMSPRKRQRKWDDDDGFWISSSKPTILDKRLKQMDDREQYLTDYAVPDSPRISRLQKTLLEELDEGEIREKQRMFEENVKKLKSSTFELRPITDEDQSVTRSPRAEFSSNRYILDGDTWMFDGKEHKVKERR